MDTVTLGSTGIVAAKNGFGALPIQRISKEQAVKLLRRAYEGGMNYFDTARAYSDSEEKLGAAFGGTEQRPYIASKTGAQTAAAFWTDLHTSLRLLKIDCIDVYQFHTPPFLPRPGDESGLYDAALAAKAQGKIRHIGITNHRLAVAREAIDSGLYETLQFPFSYLTGEKELELVQGCARANMGFISMKALAGGLIHNAAAAYAFQAKYTGVLPIWGVQKEEELTQFLSFRDDPPALTAELQEVIRRDRQELAGDFCRGCGYCMPCPAGIQINNCARMSLLLRRSPAAGWLTEEWQREMEKINGCLHCNACKSKCPYGLDTPALLKRNYADYQTFLK